MARRKKANEVPFVPLAGATTFYSTGTNDSDIITALIVPSDAIMNRSLIVGIGAGATAIVTAAWYTAASRGGTALTTPHKDSSGNLITLATMAGVVFTADALAYTTLIEGSRLFLNLDFDQVGTAGTVAVAFFLVL